MSTKLAANLSFLFKEKNFLDRFAAAAACGMLTEVLWVLHLSRFLFPLPPVRFQSC